jgi:hypothetical protein
MPGAHHRSPDIKSGGAGPLETLNRYEADETASNATPSPRPPSETILRCIAPGAGCVVHWRRDAHDPGTPSRRCCA